MALTRFTLRRLALGVFVLLGVVTLTFVISRVIPGDPASAWAGPTATEAELAAARELLGTNLPAHEQFLRYLFGIVTGDWGLSIHTHGPVLRDIAVRLPNSLQLALAGVFLAFAVGIPVGVWSARRVGRLGDHLGRVVSIFAVSVPVFWFALVLQLTFSTTLKIFPVAGVYDRKVAMGSPLADVTMIPIVDAFITGNWPVFFSAAAHLVLPAVALAIWPFGVVVRLVRAQLLDVAGDTFFQHARAVGFPERTVYWRFGLRVVSAPVVQIGGLIISGALVYTFLIEAVFSWPGIGSYTAAAVASRDTPAIMGVTLFIACVYVVANLLVDIVQAIMDPRVKLS